jgi:protein-ribulosamine 3-kinase
MTDWQAIASAIETATNRPFRINKHRSIGGGCINQTYLIDGQEGRKYFVKLNSADKHAMFVAEVAGLSEIAATQTIRVPQPITHGVAGKQSYLVLENLDLTSHGDASLLGKQLAALHSNHSDQFGFVQNNFIGITLQQNSWSDDWVGFWHEQRLKFQLRLASEKGYSDQLDDLGMKLLDALPAYFDDYSPQPSLLHGDLWGGNHAYLPDGTPVIFDPAVYYGDREADLAMMEMFGGYSTDVYAAYRAAFPLHEGYMLRRDLYNLYHILNHANMFGGGYVGQAEGMMRGLLAKAH